MATVGWELLKGIPEEGMKSVLSLGVRRTLPSGTLLFGLGGEATDLFLVESGKVNLTLPVRVGGDLHDTLVEERLPGQLLGWSGLIPPHRYTLQALAPVETELLALPREAILALFSANPTIGYAVLSNLAKVIGQRLQVFQTMWLREMQQGIERRSG